jgi:ankyrin repeat protein
MNEKEIKCIKKVLLKIYPETNGDIDYIFNNGDTVLMKAIKTKNKIAIYNILKYTKNHNLSNKSGCTALVYASKFGFFDTVKLLVEKYHVDIFKFTKKLNKASDVCKSKDIIDYLKQKEKLEYIKADLEYQNLKDRNFKLP